MSETSGQRAAAAAIVLVIAWVATYWLWEPRNAVTAEVVFDEPAVIEVIDLQPELEVTDPLAFAREENEPEREAEPEVIEEIADGPRLIPPEFTEYVVRPGDELLPLARRLYGETKYWQSIAKSNPDMDPKRDLTVGQVLRLPRDPNNFQGIVVDGEGETPPVEGPEVIEHIVQRNDSLWKIAASFYGDGTKWTIIRDANRDLVGAEGERLRPGMTLVIPAATARGAR